MKRKTISILYIISFSMLLMTGIAALFCKDINSKLSCLTMYLLWSQILNSLEIEELKEHNNNER